MYIDQFRRDAGEKIRCSISDTKAVRRYEKEAVQFKDEIILDSVRENFCSGTRVEHSVVSMLGR